MEESYAKCITRSGRAKWDLDYFNDIELDFSKAFLPEDLAHTGALHMLDKTERLRLNQIRGNAYAYLFRFVEEYIIGLVDRIGEHDGGPERAEALRIFAEDEHKHQALFQLFEQRFKEGFETHCELVGDMRGKADTLLAHSQLGLLLLTAHIEWLTQSHYLAYFDGESEDALDEGFKELFRLHWVEEAQHARIDGLETERVAQSLTEEERTQAIDEYLNLCGALNGVLQEQAALDIKSLERSCKKTYQDPMRRQLLETQYASYHHTFVTLGMKNRHFRSLIVSISPLGLSKIDHYLEQHVAQ